MLIDSGWYWRCVTVASPLYADQYEAEVVRYHYDPVYVYLYEGKFYENGKEVKDGSQYCLYLKANLPPYDEWSNECLRVMETDLNKKWMESI